VTWNLPADLVDRSSVDMEAAVISAALISVVPMASASFLEVQIDEKKLYSHVVDSLDLFCYVCLLSLTILTMWAFK
jgi:hypothetical protein